MSYISIKLPPNVVTITMAKITTTQQMNLDNRITEDSQGRITEDGEERVLETLLGLLSYPELVAIKLPKSIISVSVPK
jgi:hypothetical protein